MQEGLQLPNANTLPGSLLEQMGKSRSLFLHQVRESRWRRQEKAEQKQRMVCSMVPGHLMQREDFLPMVFKQTLPHTGPEEDTDT